MENSGTKNRLSYITLFILLIILLSNGLRYFSNRDASKPSILAWDIFGYYLYLPATFIYNDIGLEKKDWLEDIQKKYTPSSTAYQITNGVDGKNADVYHMGLSVLYVPAFFVAHIYASLAGYVTDGFSAPYQWSVLLLAFVYTIIGLFLFRKLLLHFFNDKVSSIVLILIVLGTNYFVQVSQAPELPHNFLFTLNCLIIIYTIKWHNKPTLKYAVILGLLLGEVTICRPTEIVLTLIPLLWNVSDKASLKNKIALLKEHFKHLLVIGVFICLFLFVQLSYWKYTTGNFFNMNFHTETLALFRPFTLKFLFSYKKGWLLYTPLMVIAISGFIFLFKRNRSVFYALFLFFIANLWLVSSWECWWYAGSFSQRPMVESYMIMAIPLGYMINESNKNRKMINAAVAICLTFCVVLNLFQTWQFNTQVLDAERMTRKYYWAVFGKLHAEPKTRDLLEIDRFFEPDGKEILRPGNEDKYLQKQLYFNDYENLNDKAILGSIAHSGSQSIKMDSINKYVTGITSLYNDVTKKDHFWLRASLYIYPTATFEKSAATIVFEYRTNGHIIRWAAARTDTLTFTPNKWNLLTTDKLSPYVLQKDDEFKIYVWNIGNAVTYIDDFRIEAFYPKKL